MADKKVERSGRERPLTPTQKMKAALSDPGTVNMAEPTHDKGKAALVDKFRAREERWRRDQSLQDHAAARETHTERQGPQEVVESAESDERPEGGES